jgi:mannose-6-phosphate isomerase-like protein (cupin superfamily)
MEVLDRADVELPGGGRFTLKKMGNGEERRRIVSPAGTRLSETIASDWVKGDGFPWQDAHYHKGRTEHYIVQSGWVTFLFQKEHDHFFIGWETLNEGASLVFPPQTPHIVLMGPRAVMTTVLTGTGIGNPERNGEDWWPFVPSPWASVIESVEVELSKSFQA